MPEKEPDDRWPSGSFYEFLFQICDSFPAVGYTMRHD